MRFKKKIKIFLSFFKPMILIFLSIFFDKKYLKGRYFDHGFTGIKWALKAIWVRNVLRLAPTLPFPAALNVIVSNPQNIDFHPDDLNNFQSPGTYFQNFKAKITIGHGSYIAPNVGLITANHDLDQLNGHTIGKDIKIGNNSWVGMNAVILPGTILGPKCIVAAGAVVTKSYPEGHVVLAGIPAKPIKKL